VATLKPLDIDHLDIFRGEAPSKVAGASVASGDFMLFGDFMLIAFSTMLSLQFARLRFVDSIVGAIAAHISKESSEFSFGIQKESQ
jgi:hypothetical protein